MCVLRLFWTQQFRIFENLCFFLIYFEWWFSDFFSEKKNVILPINCDWEWRGISIRNDDRPNRQPVISRYLPIRSGIPGMDGKYNRSIPKNFGLFFSKFLALPELCRAFRFTAICYLRRNLLVFLFLHIMCWNGEREWYAVQLLHCSFLSHFFFYEREKTRKC